MAETTAKKVAILIPTLGGGGAERVALASANDLAARGHKVDLLLLQRGGELIPLLAKEVRVIYLDAPRIIASLVPLARYLRDEKPDALHAVMWPVTVIAIMAHRLARSRARVAVSDQVALSRQITSSSQLRLLKLTTRLFYPLADIRIVCSKVAADDLSELSGIERKRIEVIYNPIMPPKRIATNTSAEKLWRGKVPRLITVGQMKEQKNHALMLDAFARLKTKDAQLMILGKGHLQLKLEEQAKKLGIADRLILPGFAVDPWPYLASADMFVLSSDYEGFPLVLAEAMHAGLKVVSTDCVSGPAEMLDAGRYGRLVPCGDADALAAAIDAAIQDTAEPQKMRERAIALAGPAMIERYSELLTA